MNGDKCDYGLTQRKHFVLPVLAIISGVAGVLAGVASRYTAVSSFLWWLLGCLCFIAVISFAGAMFLMGRHKYRHEEWRAVICLGIIVGMSIVSHTSNIYRGLRLIEPSYTHEDIIHAEARSRWMMALIVLYAGAHAGQYPATLGDLAKQGNIDPSGLSMPLDGSYIYLGNGLREPVDPKTLILHERLGLHSLPGAWFCYANGSLVWIPPERYKAESLKNGTRP